MPCHAGTHVDAPIHIVANGKSIEELPLDAFVGTGAVISVKKNGGEEVTAKDFESSGVEVNRGDILMLHTGWDEKFDSPDYNLHPYLSVDAAEWMVKKGIKMFGIDCITVDLPTPLRPKGFDFPVHRTLLGNNVLIAENVTNIGSIIGKTHAHHGAAAAHQRQRCRPRANHRGGFELALWQQPNPSAGSSAHA